MAAFDEAIAKAPQYANALYWRAGAKASLGDLEASIADYKAAQAAGKDDATVAWELGLSYYLQGQFDEALASFRTALERDPKRITVKLAIQR